jgi:hypothetical protein
MEEKTVDKKRISVRPLVARIAKELIVKNHYSRSWTMCTYSLGIYYTSDENHAFLDAKDEKLIGCIVYGNPIGRSAIKAISEDLDIFECVELTRLFIYDGYGKNIESLSIALSFDWLRTYAPHIKVVLSYSDPEQNHLGKIYQATNWYYQGYGAMNIMPNWSISLTKDPYHWIHSRSVYTRFGSHNIEHLKKCIGHTFWRKKESYKHRYIYFICNKKEKRKFLKTIKHPFLPYPKDVTEYQEAVEEYVIENKGVIEFF